MPERIAARAFLAIFLLILFGAFEAYPSDPGQGGPAEDPKAGISPGFDEFSVFEEDGEKRFSVSCEAEVSIGFRSWNDGFFARLGAERPEASGPASISAEAGVSADVVPGVSLALMAGLEGNGYADGGEPWDLRAFIEEAGFSTSLSQGLSARGGIIVLDSGPDPLFKPAFWPQRFSMNALAKGGASFLGLEASAYSGDLKFRALCLPEIGFPSLGLFNTPCPGPPKNPEGGSAAEARLSYSFLGGKASIFGFSQARAHSLDPIFGGFGFDAAFPLGKWGDARAEGLYSSGLPRYEASKGCLSLVDGSRSEWDLALALSLGATILSLLEFRAGYSWSGRGLPASAWECPAVAADERAEPLQRLSLSLAMPGIANSLSIALFALLCPEDLSASFYLETDFSTGDFFSLKLKGEANPFPPGRVMGGKAVIFSISLLLGISLWEAF